ncbi:hypothetical protein, partial [Staphylococcus aureus]|uniref:hypothetical protein n=1 Tax=Staphylococcus aureus TaxID=1280 RepID=UPI001CBA62D7
VLIRSHAQSKIVLLTSLRDIARGKKLFICGHTASLKTFIACTLATSNVTACFSGYTTRKNK